LVIHSFIEEHNMNINDQLTRLFMRHLLETPEGRAHLLNQVADAEDNGEASVFDQVQGYIQDPALQKAVEHHKNDEIRHAAMFRARRDAQGVKTGPVPEALQMMGRLDVELDGFFSRPISDAKGVTTAYLVLQAIEERAVNQFQFMIEAFDRVDPETARVFEAISKDEERHLRYCRAIVKRYAADDASAKTELIAMRKLESEVFAATTAANLFYCLDNNLIQGGARRFMWRAIGTIGSQVTMRPNTQFSGVFSAA